LKRAVFGILLSIVPTARSHALFPMAVEAGTIQPLGALDDVADWSPVFGLRVIYVDRAELFGNVDASFFVRASFAYLRTDAGLANELEQSGESVEDGGLLEFGTGMQAYLSGTPLFFGLGINYGTVSPIAPPGEDDSLYDSLGASTSLGLRIGSGSVALELEARIGFLIPVEVDNFNYATYSASLAFSF